LIFKHFRDRTPWIFEKTSRQYALDSTVRPGFLKISATVRPGFLKIFATVRPGFNGTPWIFEKNPFDWLLDNGPSDFYLIFTPVWRALGGFLG